MKLIIDIPEEEYELVRHGNKSYKTELELMNAVAYGTPLPEHHGRLMVLSVAKMKENQINLDFSCQKWISEVGLSYATVAILETDKEGEVDAENN